MVRERIEHSGTREKRPVSGITIFIFLSIFFLISTANASMGTGSSSNDISSLSSADSDIGLDRTLSSQVSTESISDLINLNDLPVFEGYDKSTSSKEVKDFDKKISGDELAAPDEINKESSNMMLAQSSSGSADYPAPWYPDPSLFSEWLMSPLQVSPAGNSGSASTKINIIVPPGRRSLHPNLSLSYSSSSGNGWIGVGWSIDMGYIQRNTKWGVDYSADDYVAKIKGSNVELIQRSAEWGPNYYGAKIEGQFSKYFYDGTGGWTVITKDGTQYKFGSTPASRQDDDPLNPTRVFKWSLDEVIDTNGNYMKIYYTKDQGQIYLSEIHYTGNYNTGVQPVHLIKFLPDPLQRNDVYEDYKTHFSVTTADRLKTIEVSTNGQLVRKYELGYSESPSTKRSLLDSVTLHGTQGTAFLPVSFTYSVSSQGFDSIATQWNTPVSNSGWKQDIRTQNVDGVYQDIMDMDGDGLPDRVAKGSGNFFEVYRNNGSGFDNSYTQWSTPDYSSPYIRKYDITGISEDIIDINGDGLPDRVVNGGSDYLKVYLNNGSGFDSSTNWNTPISNSNWSQYVKNSDDTGTYQDIIDMNGDGLPDRVTNGGSDYLNVYLNNGSGFNDTAIQWHTPVSNASWSQYVRNISKTNTTEWDTCYVGVISTWSLDKPSESLTYQDIKDMNGDGLPDRVTNGGSDYLKVYLNNGSGFNDNYVQWFTPDVGYSQYIINTNNTGGYQDIIDVNGDGLPDRVTNGGSNYLNVYLSNGSGFNVTPIQWLTPVTNSGWGQYPRTVNRNFVFQKPQICISYYDYDGTYTIQEIMDLNGDGLPDRITSNSSRSGNNIILYASDSSPSDLLKTVDNGLGARTTIEYAQSTQYVNNGLPFIVQTIDSVTMEDGNGNSFTTNYTYSGGLFDYTYREFRGFEFLTAIAPNDTETTTEFNQDYVKKGRPKNSYTRHFNGLDYDQYVEINYMYDTDYPLDPGGCNSPYPGVCYPRLRSQTEKIYDGDVTPIETSTLFFYDNFGNISETHYLGDINVTGDERYAYTQYYSPSEMNAWIISLPKTTYIQDSVSAQEPASQKWYTYYPAGNLWTEKSWLKDGNDPVVTYEYYPDGNLWKTTDPKGYVTMVEEYDTLTTSLPKTIKNHLGHIVTKNYHAVLVDKVETVEDANTNVVTYTYDEFGRIKKVIGPDDLASTYGTYEYFYENFGTIDISQPAISQRVKTFATEQHGTGNYLWSEVYFDGLGRTVMTRSEGSAQPVVTKTTYNNLGQVEEETLPYFEGASVIHKRIYEYDPVGRVIKTTYPDTNFATSTYTKGTLTYIDPNGHKKVEVKDVYGQIVRIDEYKGNSPSTYKLYATTEYDYDILGNLKFVRDGMNTPNVTSIMYDTLSRKKSMDDPDMGQWSYDYDANGNLEWQLDAKNQGIIFQYDELNRLKKKIYPNSTSIDYVYDVNDDGSTTNAKGRLTKIIDLSGSTIYHYDKVGNITETNKAITYSGTYTTKVKYDALGRIDELTYPDDLTVIKYVYDNGGLLKEVRDITNPSNIIVLAAYSNYNALGYIGTIDFSNGVTTAYTYYDQINENNRLKNITTSSQSNTYLDLTYDYDNIGNIRSIADPSNDLHGNSKARNFLYDEQNRLIEADSPSYGGKLIYGYDKTGNIIYNCKYGYYKYEDTDHAHAVTKIVDRDGAIIDQYSYDANGNMDSGAGRTFTYDYDNRATSIEYLNNAVVSSYDSEGIRVKKIATVGSNSKTTIYIGDIYECTDGNCSKYIFAGSQRIAKIDSTNNKTFYHTDHLGSSTILTDDNAANSQEIFYYPFGEIHPDYYSNSPRHQFTGQEWDAESGLYYYNARYYDPKLGRFISADTIVPYPIDPQSLNRYSYVLNNPLRYVDPSGHCCLAEIITIIIVIIISYAVSEAGGNVSVGASVSTDSQGKTSVEGRNPDTGEEFGTGPPDKSYSQYIGGGRPGSGGGPSSQSVNLELTNYAYGSNYEPPSERRIKQTESINRDMKTAGERRQEVNQSDSARDWIKISLAIGSTIGLYPSPYTKAIGVASAAGGIAYAWYRYRTDRESFNEFATEVALTLTPIIGKATASKFAIRHARAIATAFDDLGEAFFESFMLHQNASEVIRQDK